MLSENLIVCGCLITPNVSILSGSVFTRLEMHCKTLIKWAYYGITKITARKDLCCHCSKQGAQQDKEWKSCLKLCFPFVMDVEQRVKKFINGGLLKQLLPTKKEKNQFNIHYFYATLLLHVYYSLEPALIILQITCMT